MSTDTPLQPITYQPGEAGAVWDCLTRRPHSQRALADHEVVEMRRRYETGLCSHRQLARDFDVSRETVFRVVNRIAYKDVP